MKFPLYFLKVIITYIIRPKNFLLLIFVFLLSIPLFSSEIHLTHIDLAKCKVKYNCFCEKHIAYKAIKRALRFFKSSGYEIKTPIDIEFVKNTTNTEKNAQNCKSTTKQFLCQYNRKTKCIKISSWINNSYWNRKVFGIFPLDIEFFTSMVTHEVGHVIFDSILESRGETTDHSFHEFIAYIVQIETMKKSHKSKVLSLWPKEKLPSVFAINSFVWMAEPNKFSVLSYRLFKSQPEIIQHILNGKIKPIEMQFIMEY